ncbi:hypothetical protein AGABI2DRAFT_66472, partial [Agaricus bisporus var. bisporus H97]|uniref:hypothetical protein n=1 Tax=Agaricus bisporus var. bisporus (strain H97 / ATCC MYA-4626 / FGSC 10389) TaxID=936046 RepID=UPI00029F5236
PPPPKLSLDEASLIPEATASFFSLLTFGWITSLLGLGYARRLEATDVYKLQDSRSAAQIAEKINVSYDKRVNEVKDYNERLAAGKISPGWRSVLWMLKGKRKELEHEWRTNTGKKRPSLVFAINDSVKWWFWSAGVLKVISDTAQITTPLVVKAIVDFGIESYAGRHSGTNSTPPIGKGIGLVFCLFIMQTCASICTHHFFYRAASTGILVRGGLITAIYTRSLRLTTRARSSLPNGRIVNFISTDVSRLDFCCGYFHMSWAGPIQMVLCLALLLINLGPSALVGFGFFVLVTPIQLQAMKSFFSSRKKAMFWTDRRAKLLQELLGGIKIIKFFAWENSFLARIMDYRKRELNHIRNLLIIRAANNAVAMSMPALASVLAFVVYSASGHPLDPGIIFASLSLFNLLRLPLMFLPMSLSTIADAAQAITRLNEIFEAELLEGTRVIDHNQAVALRVQDASFTWETPEPSDEGISSQKHKADKNQSTPQKPDGSSQRTEKIFTMSTINLEIARGQLVAIVGSVGSGKSSFLQGLIGEMRRTSGQVIFGGTVAYCSQNAFIQNATVRENVCFGRPFESVRYWKAIKDACLEHDLAMLPDGDLTEVGERGISLSGGQKQRINICRAIYCDTDIQIFDDPFSALDAHVGKAVFQNVFKTTSLGKTRILVTHALHFLPEFDYIYVLSDGQIAEKGTYAEVMGHGKEFSRLINEFVSGAPNQEKSEEKAGGVVKETEPNKRNSSGRALMQTEERSVGSVSGEVYKLYLKAASGGIIVPLLVLGMCLSQVATVLSSYWLVWWQEMAFSRPPRFYMGIYAVFGVSQTFTYFFVMCVLALLTFYSSRRLFRTAIDRVLHAPMSFFETTPLGRIMNRFSKDVDNMDNVLADSLRMFLLTMSNIIGAIVLVSIVQPWFLLAVAVILVVYLYAAAFYRASARELKVHAILRSSLYSHFSESLSGLATIRAYGEVERFQAENVKRLDIENRAYWLTVTNQRWLGIRLDFLGALLTFTVGMLSVGTRFTISPSQTGVVLSYILTVQQAFGFLVRQSAEVENNMNSVERIVYYGQKIEQEAAHEAPEAKPQAPWPAGGRVELKNIFLNYRPGLPAVLKGISMDVRAGEKIGIIGRTGAGKSSIMTALYRLVELASGSILIDGVDIAKIGLSDLRNALSIIPQDPLLFSGTLRSNLDPFNLHDDATLWDALKRSYLVPSNTETKRDRIATPSAISEEGESITHAAVNRFDLDSVIEDEGSNLSIGQRSLVSFARAIVKNSKIIILDEATASVDYETDRNIQDTIAYEFKDRTILCIAHRLRTIISYDRICVLDAGQIAEFDTPEDLFKNEKGIFHGMCSRSAITLDDIKLAKRVKS